jgi:MFS family permease
MFSSITPIGQIAGPVFGGVITQFWVWRGIFFVNIPVGIVLYILVARFIPKTSQRKSEKFDVAGVVLLTLTILAGMLAITILGERGASLGNPLVILLFVVAATLGWLFFRHAGNSDAPFIPLRLLRGSGFLTMNVINFFYGTAILGFATLVPLYAENRYHIEIAQAGTATAARALGAVSIAAVSTMLLRRVGYRLPMTVGFASIAFGLVMISIAPIGLGAYWWILIFSFVAGLGIGCAAPAANNATLQLAPESVAAITGLRGMFRQMGGIVYVSIATSLLARSQDPGITQSHIFLVQALVIALTVGLVYLIPDHKGNW